MLEGNCEFAPGVEGKTLIEVWGDRPTLLLPGLWMLSTLLEEVEEALLCVGCRGMLRTEEMDEDVDLRPRRPTELRR